MGGNAKTKVIFDTDPSIDYHGKWVLNSTNIIENKKQITLTSHSAYINRSSIIFSFNGTQVKVIGEIPAGQGPVIANYTIDQDRPKCRTEPTLSQNKSLQNQMLFVSEILHTGVHNLTIDILGTGVDRNYTFQSFHVTPPHNGTGKNPDKGEIMNGQSGDKDHNPGPNVGAIVGGILGSVIFLILAFLAAFFFWRRRRLARISNESQNHLPPMIYYAQSLPDGTPRGEGLYVTGPGSYIDTDSKFAFPIHRKAVEGSRQSWVSVNMPPSIPDSAIVNGQRTSDLSSYKDLSLAVQQPNTEQLHFSPYTTTSFPPMALRGPDPLPAPSSRVRLPLQHLDTPTRTSKSSLIRNRTAV